MWPDVARQRQINYDGRHMRPMYQTDFSGEVSAHHTECDAI